MDKKSKRKIIQKEGKYFTLEEKHFIIQELISSKCTKREIWDKYTGEPEEKGQLLRWMRTLGYSCTIKTRRPNLATNSYLMPKKRKTDSSDNPNDESFELLQLKKRNAELEKQLKDAELKAIAFSTMVDIAEEMFKIPIRKKLNTKP